MPHKSHGSDGRYERVLLDGSLQCSSVFEGRQSKKVEPLYKSVTQRRLDTRGWSQLASDSHPNACLMEEDTRMSLGENHLLGEWAMISRCLRKSLALAQQDKTEEV